MLDEQIIVCIHLVMKTKQINKPYLNTTLFKQIQDPTYQKKFPFLWKFLCRISMENKDGRKKNGVPVGCIIFFKFCYVPRFTASNSHMHENGDR